MQEMLDAEDGGYGEFNDDFDEIDGWTMNAMKTATTIMK